MFRRFSWNTTAKAEEMRKNVEEPLEELYIQSTFKGLFLEKEKLKSLEFPMRVYYRLSWVVQIRIWMRVNYWFIQT